MTQNEINELKKGDRTILLETMQSVTLKHIDLPTALIIFWRHDTHDLLITRATDKGYLELRRPIDITTKDILLLNYEHVGHERVYKIEIDTVEKKIKLTELHEKNDYRLTVKVSDNQLTTDKTNLIKSWEQAEKDLKIKIQTPFKLTVGKKIIDCYLLIEGFGSKKGTVILSINNMDDFDEPKKLGYHCSALNPDNYSTYDRNHFIDTLNDWGFFGDKEETPEWYTGQSWT